MTWAGSLVPSGRMTKIKGAWIIVWVFVTIMPVGSMTSPAAVRSKVAILGGLVGMMRVSSVLTATMDFSVCWIRSISVLSAQAQEAVSKMHSVKKHSVKRPNFIDIVEFFSSVIANDRRERGNLFNIIIILDVSHIYNYYSLINFSFVIPECFCRGSINLYGNKY